MLKTYLLVIDFAVANTDGDSLIKLHANFMEDLLNCSGNHTSLLVVVGQPEHRESFTRSSLAIAHNGPIVTRYHIGNGLS